MNEYILTSDGELYHWKYTSRKKVNGKWVYTYDTENDRNGKSNNWLSNILNAGTSSLDRIKNAIGSMTSNRKNTTVDGHPIRPRTNSVKKQSPNSVKKQSPNSVKKQSPNSVMKNGSSNTGAFGGSTRSSKSSKGEKKLMTYSIKSVNVEKKSARARNAIANDKRFADVFNRRIADLRKA